MTGRVVSLQLCRQHGLPPEPVAEVLAVAGQGLAGDVHHGREKRGVLLVDVDSLRTVDLVPGDLREQITVDLPGLHDLPAGTRLRAGDAVIELTGPCEPCTHIGELLGKEDREAFRRSLDGRRGVLGQVVAVTAEGRIRVGDPVTAGSG